MNASEPTAARLSVYSFADRFIRIPDGSGRLVPLTLHAEQRRVFDAYDLIDEATKLPWYFEILIAWPKKTGKTGTVGVFAGHELVCGREPDREIALCSSDLGQSVDVVLACIIRYCRRHPWLAKRIKIYKNVLIYSETVVDHRTGARHVQEHVLRAIPVRDTRSMHGLNPSMTIFDEYWSQQTYEAVEALAASPARRISRTIYSTYAGLRSQARPGNPLWDVWQRGLSGDDPRLFASIVSGPDAWRIAPWISESFIAQQRRRFASVIAEYRRLFENTWASGDEGSFLSADEIASAVDVEAGEPERGDPGVAYDYGLDVGLTHDWSALAVTHPGADGRIVVDVIRYWRGTRQRPVSLSAVEAEIVSLAARFKPRRVIADLWQAAMLAERLALAGIHNVSTKPITPGRLDSLATALKSTFSRRLIRIPGAAPWSAALVEQLECIVGQEMSRREYVRFTSGAGEGAGRHDDLAIALSLCLEVQQGEIGRAVLPENFNECYRASDLGRPVDCFVMGMGNFIPPGNSDPSCAACPGWRFLRDAYAAHKARGGEPIDLRGFRRAYITNNDFVAMRLINKMAHDCGI